MTELFPHVHVCKDAGNDIRIPSVRHTTLQFDWAPTFLWQNYFHMYMYVRMQAMTSEYLLYVTQHCNLIGHNIPITELFSHDYFLWSSNDHCYTHLVWGRDLHVLRVCVCLCVVCMHLCVVCVCTYVCMHTPVLYITIHVCAWRKEKDGKTIFLKYMCLLHVQ